MKVAVCINDFPTRSFEYLPKDTEIISNERGEYSTPVKGDRVYPGLYPHFFRVEERRWTPEEGEQIYIISWDGRVYGAKYNRDYSEGFKHGNSFPTREAAQARVEAVSKALKGE